MTGGLEINKLIMETISEHAPSESVVQLILESLQYELDIWNRYLPQSEISNQYEIIIDRIVNRMIE